MSNFLKTSLLLICSFFALNLNAQTAADEAALLKGWNDIWQAYESGEEAKIWAFYAENACEIYPDGSCICGREAIRQSYEAFKGMLEGKPSWTMTPPTVRFLGPDVVMLLSDVTADIKLKGGQQIGGKSKFMALLRKTDGQWLIEFTSQTPVIPMTGN